MPNKVSAEKRVRQAAAARLRNRAKRSDMRTAIKKVRKMVEVSHPTADNLAGVDAAMQAAQKKIGKAMKTRLIKKNTGARMQSRLAKAIKKARKAAGLS